MARPITRFAHNQCVECGADIGKVIYIRPFAKMCTDCKTNAWSGNAEVKKVLHQLRLRNSKMTPEELGEDEKFEDDPRAEKEIQYGRVTKRETTLSNNATLIERNFHV